MTVTLLYFARIREQIGMAEENVDLPVEVRTVGDLVQWLKSRSEGHAVALADPSIIRVALDQEYALPGDPLGNAREIALFPPVTGGA